MGSPITSLEPWNLVLVITSELNRTVSVGQERLGPSYFFIPFVLGPLNSLVWYVPSLRYTRGLGWRMLCGAEVRYLWYILAHICRAGIFHG